MNKKPVVTSQGYHLLQKEISALQKEISALQKEIVLARLEGDISENSQFLSTEEELLSKMSKMSKMQELFENAEVLENQSSSLSIELGSVVKILIFNPSNGEKKELNLIVTDSFLANPGENKISINSPLANSLLGKKAGDSAEINGNSIKILEIK